MSTDNNTLPTTESVKAFCAALSIGPTCFYKNVKLGHIKILKVGRKTLVRASEREAFLARVNGGAI